MMTTSNQTLPILRVFYRPFDSAGTHYHRHMSRFVADHLPGPLFARLSLDAAFAEASRAIVMCTIDEHGWPHPAMLSSLEVVARDARNIRLCTYVSSRSTRNLKANGILTLVLADQRAVYYVKGDVILLAGSLRESPDNAKFNLRVDSVLEDTADATERATILSGIQVTRQFDEDHAAAVLRELLED
jgi:hypothetical protein